jgi:DNA-binding transcriptional MerR regulator
MRMKDTYRISELAEKAGVTKRTIHYYVGRGLLPPPDGAGVASMYREEHLLKLKLIKQLQERYYPLDRIRSVIVNMTLEDIKRQLAQPNTASALSEEPDISNAEMITEMSTIQSNTKDLKMSDIRSSYIRCKLGLGIELHVPIELARENSVLIENIEKYVRKLTSEK